MNIGQTLKRDSVVIALRDEIKVLRESIASTLSEIDFIRLQANHRIEAEYALKIGCYENELLKSDIAARREKRKYTLLLSAINSGQKPDLTHIEAQLNHELHVWEEHLQAAYDRYRKLLFYRKNSRFLSEKDSKRITHLYRIIVKRLHPDVCPNTTEWEQTLFFSAQSAYERGDLVSLEAIAVTVEGLGEKDLLRSVDMDTRSVLEAEVLMLTSTQKNIEERLLEIKAETPYCYAEKLKDKKWVINTVLSIKEKIIFNQNVRVQYLDRIKGLTRESGCIS